MLFFLSASVSLAVMSFPNPFMYATDLVFLCKYALKQNVSKSMVYLNFRSAFAKDMTPGYLILPLSNPVILCAVRQ